MKAVAIKKGPIREKIAGLREMGTLRCDGCGEEFLIGHDPAFAGYGRSRTGVLSLSGQDAIAGGLCEMPFKVFHSSATHEAARSCRPVSSGEIHQTYVQVGDF
jgi:hypothetical protein